MEDDFFTSDNVMDEVGPVAAELDESDIDAELEEESDSSAEFFGFDENDF